LAAHLVHPHLPERSQSSRRWSILGLGPARLLVIVGVLALEDLVAVHSPHTWLTLDLLKGTPIVFGLVLLFFSRKQLRQSGLQPLPVSYRFAALHAAAFALFAVLEFYLASPHAATGAWHYRALAILWTLLIPVLAVSLAAVFIPVRRMFLLARSFGAAWAYAAVCALSLAGVRQFARLYWDSSSSQFSRMLQQAALNGAKALLQLFYPTVIAIPDRHILGTPKFLVRVSAVCSGMEGLGLISLLTILWLIFARRELRLKRAILLVPLALLSMWLMNIVRLAALIAIGSAGYRKIADGGFHAQAGWIALNLVSLGFLLAAQRVRWFHQPLAATSDPNTPGLPDVPAGAVPLAEAPRNVPVIYLAPLATILVASVLSQAVSSGFEWLYPLRWVAALLVLWSLRREYRRMDWSFGWLGPAAGLVVAALWIALHYLTGPRPLDSNIVAGLRTLSHGQTLGWNAIRFLAAITTVPLAEELAFRGFLARRIMAPDVEHVPFRRLSVLSILISSACFGLFQGRMWIAGLLAGLIFALVAKYRDRLGEAVAAHATANLVISIVVLIRHDYTLW
jgi:exosortase E/protease (VPEID-CTERM system)